MDRAYSPVANAPGSPKRDALFFRSRQAGRICVKRPPRGCRFHGGSSHGLEPLALRCDPARTGFAKLSFSTPTSLWHDEAALVLNVLDRDFHRLLGPLLLSEAAPPLFLWLERAVVLVLGDGLYALRLLPFVSSCLALLLFARLARRWLPGAVAAWTVLLFACSDRFLWHGCEAKPYATDLFLSTLVLTAYSVTRSWDLLRRILFFTLISPLIIWLSYPGCFLCSGLLLTLLPEVVRARRMAAWSAYSAWAGLVGLSFVLLLLGPIQAQSCGTMTQCWIDLFPDWSQPWSVPAWCVVSTLDLFHYFCQPLGQFLAVLVPLGLWPETPGRRWMDPAFDSADRIGPVGCPAGPLSLRRRPGDVFCGSGGTAVAGNGPGIVARTVERKMALGTARAGGSVVVTPGKHDEAGY